LKRCIRVLRRAGRIDDVKIYPKKSACCGVIFIGQNSACKAQIIRSQVKAGDRQNAGIIDPQNTGLDVERLGRRYGDPGESEHDETDQLDKGA